VTLPGLITVGVCLLASSHVPYGNGAIERRGDHLIAARVETNRYDFTCVTLEVTVTSMS
jgi:hypothetical protein